MCPATGGYSLDQASLSYGANYVYSSGHVKSASGQMATPAFGPGNGQGILLSAFVSAANTILATDWNGAFASGQFAPPAGYFPPMDPILFRHNGMVNVAFCDGHVKAMPQSNITETHPTTSPAGDTVSYQFTVEDD